MLCSHSCYCRNKENAVAIVVVVRAEEVLVQREDLFSSPSFSPLLETHEFLGKREERESLQQKDEKRFSSFRLWMGSTTGRGTRGRFTGMRLATVRRKGVKYTHGKPLSLSLSLSLLFQEVCSMTDREACFSLQTGWDGVVREESAEAVIICMWAK